MRCLFDLSHNLPKEELNHAYGCQLLLKSFALVIETSLNTVIDFGGGNFSKGLINLVNLIFATIFINKVPISSWVLCLVHETFLYIVINFRVIDGSKSLIVYVCLIQPPLSSEEGSYF